MMTAVPAVETGMMAATRLGSSLYLAAISFAISPIVTMGMVSLPTQQVTSRPSRKMTAWADFLPRMRRTSLLMTQSMPPASETMPIVPAIKTNSRIMLAMPYMPFATVVRPRAD